MRITVAGLGQCGRRIVWELFYTLYHGVDTSINQLTLRTMASKVYSGFIVADTVEYSLDPRIQRFWKMTRRGKAIVLDDAGSGGLWIGGRRILGEKCGAILEEAEKQLLEARMLAIYHGSGGTGAGGGPVLASCIREHAERVIGPEASRRLYLSTLVLPSEKSPELAANAAAAVTGYYKGSSIDALVIVDNAASEKLSWVFEKTRMFHGEAVAGLGLYPRLSIWPVNKALALHNLWTAMMSPVLTGPGRVVDISKEREASEIKTILRRGDEPSIAVPFYFEVSRDWLDHFALEFLVLYGIIRGMMTEIDYRRGLDRLLLVIGIPVSLRYRLRYDESRLEEFLSTAMPLEGGLETVTVTYSSRRPLVVAAGLAVNPEIPRLATLHKKLVGLVEGAGPGSYSEELEVLLRDYEAVLSKISRGGGA